MQPSPPLAMTITIVTINMKKSKLENPTCVCHQQRSLRQCPALWSYWTGWKPAFITMMMRILIIIVTFIVIITSIVIVTLSTRAKRELKRLPREKHLLRKKTCVKEWMNFVWRTFSGNTVRITRWWKPLEYTETSCVINECSCSFDAASMINPDRFRRWSHTVITRDGRGGLLIDHLIFYRTQVRS